MIFQRGWHFNQHVLAEVHSFHCHTLCAVRVVVQVCGADSVQEAIHTYIHSYIHALNTVYQTESRIQWTRYTSIVYNMHALLSVMTYCHACMLERHFSVRNPL